MSVIKFYRESSAKITATVIPAKGSSDEHVEACKNRSKTELNELDPEIFADIMI
jgi:hypothetical protein